MAVTWTLKDASGGNLTTQPTSTGTLTLNFNNSGYPYFAVGETINEVYAEVDSTGPITVTLGPQNSGYYLDQVRSDPQELPSPHGGVMSWTDSGGTTTLTFTAPGTVNQEWSWGFGGLNPPVALKMKVRVRRT
ncbi:hypothetical protein [Nannocystis punicea]|uniref:Uncharacterized protein n=1 Tax=Nannocystis punicea TaxID=2995304 RepID=A0ABY7GVP2_9BACT|nr:hypothetical protein [Nannocystis poenicansa]WAS91026.1 hypothetical protein O0S08_32965 [Nannocystis poenicansa]